MERFSDLKHGLEQAWHSVSDGWRHLIERTAGALTRFTPSTREADRDQASTSDEQSVTVEGVPATGGWGLLAGDVYEDDDKLVVRLEVPGMAREDFDLEVRSDVLIVHGEKRLERESTKGHYRVRQCAYGHFHRTFPLPTAVDADQVRASYRDGVLRVELPKRSPTASRHITINA